MERVAVRLVSDDPAWSAERSRQLAPVADIVVTATLDMGGLRSPARPAVVVVDAGPDVERTLDALAPHARRDTASAYVLALRGDDEPAAFYPRAALAGVRVVLPGRGELPELTEAIYQAADCVSGSGDEAAGSGSPPDRVHAVFGTKGGVGKTTLAVNLAAALARRGLRTALLDLHLDWGTAAIHLRGAAPRPYRDLLVETRRLDPDLLQTFMVRHGSGVWLLPAPPKPEVAEFVRPEHVQALLATARDGFEAVVVDTPAGFPETIFPVLEGADDLLLLTTPDVPSLRNGRSALAVLERLRLGHAKLHLVLNRAGRGFGVRRADVEATLGMQVWASLPNDEAVAVRAANEGVPVVELAPGSRLGTALVTLSRQVVPETRAHHGHWRHGTGAATANG